MQRLRKDDSQKEEAVGLGCTLALPGDPLKVLKPGPHPRPIKAQSLGVGHRDQYFLKVPK